jgi:hypothetical protein
MTTKKKAPAKKPVKRTRAVVADMPAATSNIPTQLQEFLNQTSIPKGFVNAKQLAPLELRKRMTELNLRTNLPLDKLLASINRIKPAAVPVEKMPEEIKMSARALSPQLKRLQV